LHEKNGRGLNFKGVLGRRKKGRSVRVRRRGKKKKGEKGNKVYLGTEIVW
jgi:hypothetical protein